MKYGKKLRNGGSITTNTGHINHSGMYHLRNTNPYPDPIKLKNEYLSKLLNAVENGEAYKLNKTGKAVKFIGDLYKLLNR